MLICSVGAGKISDLRIKLQILLQKVVMLETN